MLIESLESRCLLSAAVVNITRNSSAQITAKSNTTYHFNGHTSGRILVWDVSNVSIDHVKVTASDDYDVFVGGGSVNVTVTDADLSGAKDAGLGAYGVSNLIVRNVVAHNNPGNAASSTSGSGIELGYVSGGTITSCTAYANGGKNAANGGGPVGIWAYQSSDVTIQACESYGNKSRGQDGGGFDLDGGCTNCSLVNDSSHGNAGPGFLMCQYAGASAWSNNTIIDCSSTNNSVGLELYTPAGMSLNGLAVSGFSSSNAKDIVIQAAYSGLSFARVATPGWFGGWVDNAWFTDELKFLAAA